MFGQIKRMPGAAAIPEFRIELRSKLEDRPLVLPHVTSTEALVEFLRKELDFPKIEANRLAAEATCLPARPVIIENLMVDDASVYDMARRLNRQHAHAMDGA